MKISMSFFLIFSVVVPFTAFAQLGLDAKLNLPNAAAYKAITKYRTIINLNNKKRVIGFLYKVSDETIILIPKDKDIEHYAHFVNLVKKDQIAIKTPHIFRMNTRKKGRLGKSFLIGAGLGLGLGLLAVGTAEGTVPEGNVTIGVPLLTGGLLGLIIGSFSKSHNLKDATKLAQLKKRAIMYGR